MGAKVQKRRAARREKPYICPVRVPLQAFVRIQSVLLLSACFLCACSGTRYVPSGQHLLHANPAFAGNKVLSGGVLEGAITTHANRKVLTARLYLSFHNQGTSMTRDTSAARRLAMYIPLVRNANDRTVRWLLYGIGEPPAIINKDDLRKDSARLRSTYFANGFFYPSVRIAIDTSRGIGRRDKRQASVKFRIAEGKPFILKEITYDIADSALKAAYLSSRYTIREKTGDTLWLAQIRPGQRYSQAAIGAERGRIGDVMKNKGFFNFSPEWVHFVVDTSYSRLVLQIVGPEQLSYTISDVKVRLFGARDSSHIEKVSTATLSRRNIGSFREKYKLSQSVFSDTLPFTFITSARVIDKVNYNFVSERIQVFPGQLYSQRNIRQTQSRLQDLGMFQYVVMTYKIDDVKRTIEVTIDLRFAPQYQFRGGIESFNTNEFNGTNAPVIGANISYRDKNAFRRSELLEMKIGGNIGYYRAGRNAIGDGQSVAAQVFGEINAKVSLSVPRIMLPIPQSKMLLIGRYNASNYSPATSWSINYRQEQRQQYSRTVTGIALNYRWNHYSFDPSRSSRFEPLAMDYIDVRRIDSSFASTLEKQTDVVRREYISRFSTRASYTFVHSHYMATRVHPTGYFRGTIGWGGNIPYLLDVLTRADGNIRDNSFNGLLYGRYVKGQVEGKGFFPINGWSEIVVRGVIGAATAYDRNSTIPPEVRYFSGGANTMRAWQSNTLGPGRIQPSDFDSTNTVSNLLVPGGEYQLEGNLELRFNAGTYLEVALFTEAGNVWFNNRTNLSPILKEKATLTRDNLRLGWDAGIGFRFDFSFLILRIDVAQQLYNPGLSYGWALKDGFAASLRAGHLRPQLGIGYPF